MPCERLSNIRCCHWTVQLLLTSNFRTCTSVLKYALPSTHLFSRSFLCRAFLRQWFTSDNLHPSALRTCVWLSHCGPWEGGGHMWRLVVTCVSCGDACIEFISCFFNACLNSSVAHFPFAHPSTFKFLLSLEGVALEYFIFLCFNENFTVWHIPREATECRRFADYDFNLERWGVFSREDVQTQKIFMLKGGRLIFFTIISKYFNSVNTITLAITITLFSCSESN